MNANVFLLYLKILKHVKGVYFETRFYGHALMTRETYYSPVPSATTKARKTFDSYQKKKTLLWKCALLLTEN